MSDFYGVYLKQLHARRAEQDARIKDLEESLKIMADEYAELEKKGSEK